jgi:CheY-like chemotaxis protein
MVDRSQFIEILLVEDNPVDARMIREALHIAEIKHNLTIVGDGESALQFLHRETPHENAPVPQIVLLDLRLPRVSGHAVLAAMKGHPQLKSIPVLILTSSAAQQDMTTSYDLAANHFVTKPIGLKVLAGELKIIEGLVKRAGSNPGTK